MATLRDIKSRITGVKNTQQITKAMKMVAAARLRRAQENIINARPYSRKISQVLAHLLSVEKDINNPLFEIRPAEKVAILLVTSDRGLCGAFNMNVIRQVETLLKEDYAKFVETGNLDLFTIGKKGDDYFKRLPYNIAESYPHIFAHLKFEFAAGLMNKMKEFYINGTYDRVVIVYNKFKSVIQQDLTVEQLLPIEPFDKTEEDDTTAEYIYEPNKTEIINYLLPKQLNAQLWQALLESYAAELGARMTAMDMATENAKEMIKQLQMTYNKERQASITSEIIEIVSGANALKA
ncbi:MAG: ATP synthase gamma chain [Melioribacteraceae bacterium]|nr:MAG: ATP synthase gamma chain [Melioribacteraceae bacterium]